MKEIKFISSSINYILHKKEECKWLINNEEGEGRREREKWGGVGGVVLLERILLFGSLITISNNLYKRDQWEVHIF